MAFRFRNRSEFGFRNDGCIYGIDEMVAKYREGDLTDLECLCVDRHLLECRVCENAWDARMDEWEETFPYEIRDIEENELLGDE